MPTITNPNDSSEVSGVKGVEGGYAFSAPTGTTLPTDNTTALASAFDNIGYISDGGIVESEEESSNDVVDMNGDVVAVLNASQKETIKITLISLNVRTLKEYYGHSNVTATSSLISVTHNTTPRSSRSYVFELLLKDGRKWRKVVPNGKVTSVSDLTLASGQVFGREITITCSPDSSGNRQYDYIDAAAPSASTGSGS